MSLWFVALVEKKLRWLNVLDRETHMTLEKDIFKQCFSPSWRENPRKYTIMDYLYVLYLLRLIHLTRDEAISCRSFI